MKTKWDKKMSVALTATMMLSVAPVNVLAKPDAKIVQSEPEEVYVDIIGEGQRSTWRCRMVSKIICCTRKVSR